MDGDVPDWEGKAVEGKVANEEEDVVLGAAPGRGGGDAGIPSSVGEDGRDGCFNAERSIEENNKNNIFL